MAIVFLLGPVGCDSAAGEETAGATTHPEAQALPECPPDTGVEPLHTDTAGAYSVPVPAELEPYATYPVDSITACRRGELVELGYKLPALLVGKETHVGFSGSYDEAAAAFVLSGNGTASCAVTNGSWSCFEEFAGITVDLAAVAEETQGLSAAEAQGRLDVSQAFGADPIGILDFVP
ncbi:MAG TPA: hypothetical protein VFB62_23025 [Polyangiaceae bacterium]|nr:hypothetical protein [Polyangiaceae bacterium]